MAPLTRMFVAVSMTMLVVTMMSSVPASALDKAARRSALDRPAYANSPPPDAPWPPPAKYQPPPSPSSPPYTPPNWPPPPSEPYTPPPWSPPPQTYYPPPPPPPSTCNTTCGCPIGGTSYAKHNLTCLSPFLYNYDRVSNERAQYDLAAPAKAAVVLADLLATDGSVPFVANEGGIKWSYDIGNFPYLSKIGMSQTMFRLAPCSINLPHYHPRGVELISVVQGQFNLTVVEENGGRTVTVPLDGTGQHLQSYPVPQALPHAEENMSCDDTLWISTFNSADPGVVTLGSALAHFSVKSFATAFNMTDSDATDYRKVGVTRTGLFQVEECIARCNLSKK